MENKFGERDRVRIVTDEHGQEGLMGHISEVEGNDYIPHETPYKVRGFWYRASELALIADADMIENARHTAQPAAPDSVIPERDIATEKDWQRDNEAAAWELKAAPDSGNGDDAVGGIVQAFIRGWLESPINRICKADELCIKWDDDYQHVTVIAKGNTSAYITAATYWQTVACGQACKIDDLEAENARLEAALEPFAKLYEQWLNRLLVDQYFPEWLEIHLTAMEQQGNYTRQLFENAAKATQQPAASPQATGA